MMIFPIVIPGRALQRPNPESRGSGFDAAHRPGTTVINKSTARRPACQSRSRGNRSRSPHWPA
ncbi:hypothetical protein E3H11_37130 [Bradyrhizobium brasilense]|nr:hypothetical protein [Bradyrhizobium brasilense]